VHKVGNKTDCNNMHGERINISGSLGVVQRILKLAVAFYCVPFHVLTVLLLV